MSLAPDEIEKVLDKTFKRCSMADDDGETPLTREVYALEQAVRDTLAYLREMPNLVSGKCERCEVKVGSTEKAAMEGVIRCLMILTHWKTPNGKAETEENLQG